MGDFCLSRGPLTVPLIQILPNTFIFKSQAGILCNSNWVGKVDNKFKRAYCHNIYVVHSKREFSKLMNIGNTNSNDFFLFHNFGTLNQCHLAFWLPNHLDTVVNCFVFLALVFNALLEFNTIQTNICLILFWKYVLLRCSTSVLVFYVGSWIMWFISSWDKNNFFEKLNKFTKWFISNLTFLSGKS